MNRLILCLKRNDQLNVFKKNTGAKHLMPIFWHDETTMGEFNFTDRLQTQAFLHLELPRDSNIDFLRELVSSEQPDGDIDTILRAHKYRFNESDFISSLGVTDLSAKLKSPDHMPLIDGSPLNLQNIAVRSILTDYSKIESSHDIKAVTSGTFTVGGGGGEDYAKLSAAAADSGTQTGTLTFNINSDFTETSSADFNHDAASNTLIIGATNDHGGDITAAHVMTGGHGGGLLFLNLTNPGSGNEVKNFRIERNTAASSANIGSLNSGSPAMALDVFGMYFTTLATITGTAIRANTEATSVSRYWNNLIDNYANGIFIQGSGGTLTFENMGVLNCATNGINPSNITSSFRNVWCFGNGTDWVNLTNVTGNNLSASDTTAFGTNAHDSLTLGDEVISTDDTESDFGHLKAGGTNDGGGSAPTIPTTDLAGVTYASPFPVGPFMLPPSPPAVGDRFEIGIGIGL